jgi:hypothetical protein
LLAETKEKGLSSADSYIEYGIYKDMRDEESAEYFLKAIELGNKPLNLEFSMFYLTESYQLSVYKEQLKELLKKKQSKVNDIVFNIDSNYVISILDKLNVNTFNSDEYGYLDKYYCIGPFIKDGILDFENRLDFEKSPKIDKEYSTFYGKQKPYLVNVNSNGWVDLSRIYNKRFGIVYFLNSVNFKSSGRYYINTASSFPYRLFIDGKLVCEKRYMDLSSSVKKIIEIDVKKGEHTILLKIDASNELQGYYLEDNNLGFMIQFFDEKGNYYLPMQGNFKKGKINSCKVVDIQDHFKDSMVVKRAEFKLANIFMNYGNGIKSFNMISGLLKESDSPIYSFFAGFVCERFPILGFSDYAYNYYTNSTLNWDDNYIADFFIAKNYMINGNKKEAKKYLLKLEPNSNNIFLFNYIANIRNDEGLENYASKYLFNKVRDHVSDLAVLNLYNNFSNYFDSSKMGKLLAGIEEVGIFSEDFISKKLNYLISLHKYDEAYDFVKTIKNKDLKYDLMILLSASGYDGMENIKEVYLDMINRFPQNSDYYDLLCKHYLKKNKYAEYEQIKNRMLKKFASIDDEKDYEIFGPVLPDKLGTIDETEKYPFEIVDQKTRLTFFKDLGYRRIDYGIIRVNDQKGVGALTNFTPGGNPIFIKIQNSDGKKYYFHSSNKDQISLKGLEVGSVIEYATIGYYSRPFLNIYYTGITPITLLTTYPIKKWKVQVDIPKAIDLKPFVIHRNYILKEHSKSSVLKGYRTYLYSAKNLKRVKQEKGIPNPYTFTTAIILQSKLLPSTYLQNFYNEIFTDKFLGSKIKQYFDSFAGDKEKKMIDIYDDLEVNYTEDTSSDSDKSLLNIILTKKAGPLDKIRIFKAALDYWRIPNKFVIFSGFGNKEIKRFFPGQIDGQGILLNYKEKNILTTFSSPFIPFGGESGKIKIAYMTENGRDYSINKEFSVGTGSGLKIDYVWDLENKSIDVKVKFIGAYSSYKTYFFDAETKEKIVNQFVGKIFQYIKVDTAYQILMAWTIRE